MKNEKERWFAERVVEAKACREKNRCKYLSETGRRCRLMAVSAGSGFCAAHERKKQADVTKLVTDLEEFADSFHTPEGISDVMFLLFFALLEGRITERKAGILTYMLQTALHAQRAIERKKKLEVGKVDPLFRPLSWNLPPSSEDDDSEPPREEVPKCSADLPVGSAVSQATNGGAEVKIEEAEEKEAGIKASATEKNSDATEAASKAPASEGGRYKNPPQPAVNGGSSSSTSSTSFTSSASSSRPADLNHFFPVDPTLPARVQDPNRVPPPPASPEEIARRNQQFDRRHGFTRRGKQSFPSREAPDWKILNGR